MNRLHPITVPRPQSRSIQKKVKVLVARDRMPGTHYQCCGGDFRPAEDSMANQDDHTGNNEDRSDKNEMRLMWIGSGVIVLLILGLMGYNMIFNSNMPPDSTEMSSQSRTAPARAPAQ